MEKEEKIMTSSSSETEISICLLTDVEVETIHTIRLTDVILFGILALLWMLNILLIVLWRHHSAKNISAAVLYTIVGIIIISRMTEVIELTVYDPNVLTTVSGTIATYAKIALGCCQIFAMLEIRN